MKLSTELQNEQNRRLELEKQLEQLKIDSESKVTSTAEWAQEQGQKLKKELDKIKAKQRKRNEKVNQRMKMLLQALKDEMEKKIEAGEEITAKMRAELQPLLMGQAAANVRNVQPAKQIIEEMIAGAILALRHRTGQISRL